MSRAAARVAGVVDAMARSTVGAGGAVNVYERSPKLKAPARPGPRVVRHRGTLDGGVLSLERGAWIRTLTADGDEVDDVHDPRWLCRLELGDVAVATEAGGAGICALRIVAVLADWGRKFGVTGAAFDGAAFVLPATGLRAAGAKKGSR